MPLIVPDIVNVPATVLPVMVYEPGPVPCKRTSEMVPILPLKAKVDIVLKAEAIVVPVIVDIALSAVANAIDTPKLLKLSVWYVILFVALAVGKASVTVTVCDVAKPLMVPVRVTVLPLELKE